MRNHINAMALRCTQLAIRCNSIHPGATPTPIREPMPGQGADRTGQLDALIADMPPGRFGLPEEVTVSAVLLVSDEAGCITGTDRTTDRGPLAGFARPGAARRPYRSGRAAAALLRPPKDAGAVGTGTTSP